MCVVVVAKESRLSSELLYVCVTMGAFAFAACFRVLLPQCACVFRETALHTKAHRSGRQAIYSHVRTALATRALRKLNALADEIIDSRETKAVGAAACR